MNFLAIALGVYREAQTRLEFFYVFMASCTLWKDERANLANTCTELRLGPFTVSSTKVSQWKFLDHRVIHRMLVNIVHQRKSSHDKVDKIDLWILEQIVVVNCYINVPIVLAKLFVDARGYRENSGIYMANTLPS